MGCMDRALREEMLGGGLSLAEIGRRVDRHEATVAYWMQKHGLRAVHAGGMRRAGRLTPRCCASSWAQGYRPKRSPR